MTPPGESFVQSAAGATESTQLGGVLSMVVGARWMVSADYGIGLLVAAPFRG